MRPSKYQVPPPRNWQDFEDLCYELWKLEWRDNAAKKNGRQGQAQAGVDIFGRVHGSGGFIGIQCKGKDINFGRAPTEAELLEEVERAKKFQPALVHFIMATTAQRDVALQEAARRITQENERKKLFSVEICFWEDIADKLHGHRSLLRSYLEGFGTTGQQPDESKVDISVPRKDKVDSEKPIWKIGLTTLSLFDERLRSAFPGERRLAIHTSPSEGIRALSKLLSAPLEFFLPDGGRVQPIWWFRGGSNSSITEFDRLRWWRRDFLLDGMECRFRRLATFRQGSYKQSFLYVELDPIEPTGLYPESAQWITRMITDHGYAQEEYAILKLFGFNWKIRREEYDDGATKLFGRVIQTDGRVELRSRNISAFNFIIAPQGSPINNAEFDPTSEIILNGILRGTHSVEDLADAIVSLPIRGEY